MKPGPALLILSLLLLAAGTAGFFSQTAYLIWLFSGAVLLIPVIIDAVIVRFLHTEISASRQLHAAMAIGKKERVRVSLKRGAEGYLPRTIRIFDIYPPCFVCEAFPLKLKKKQWNKSQEISFSYTILPMKRSQWQLETLELLLQSPLGFWQKKIVLTAENRGRIFPDFKSMLRLSASSLKGVYQSIGLKNRRRRGQGMEFLNLRDYRDGDSIRSIDWRATSRIGKPIVKEYTEDQNQQVLLIIDSGYRLFRQDGPYLQFDSALNAALMLSYAALTHGDSVAVSSFGNDERWISPVKGRTSVSILLNRLYDLQCAPVPSSPFAALEKAAERLTKRTFIILLSNLREEDGESLSWILPRIQKKHLLLTVSLTESEVNSIVSSHPDGRDGILEKAAAQTYIRQRRRLFKKWEHSGLLTLEASPQELSASLINSYLDIKKSGRL